MKSATELAMARSNLAVGLLSLTSHTYHHILTVKPSHAIIQVVDHITGGEMGTWRSNLYLPHGRVSYLPCVCFRGLGSLTYRLSSVNVTCSVKPNAGAREAVYNCCE